MYKIKRFADIRICQGNWWYSASWNEMLEEGLPVTYYVVSSKPTDNIKITTLTDMHFYYVKDENEIFAYGDLANTGTNSWVSFALILFVYGYGEFALQGEAIREKGEFVSVPDITGNVYVPVYDCEKGYYQYTGDYGNEWAHLYEPRLGNLYITKAGKYTTDGSLDGYNTVNANFDQERLRAIIGRTATELIPSDFYQNLGANYGYTDIADYAFYKYDALTKVEIGTDYKTRYNSKMHIGAYAFADCTNLASVDFENVFSVDKAAFRNTGITEIISSHIGVIGEFAFENCNSLVSVRLSFEPADGYTPLISYGWTFRNCTSLTNVVFTATKLSFGSSVFDGCTNLESITLDTPNVPSIKADTFPSTLKHIYVRADMVESIKAGENWSAYADIVSAIV